MTRYKLECKKPPIASLIALISFASVGSVLISPAMPEISRYYSISANDSQYVITLFLLGYACAQLIYGPIANRFGRKKAINAGISLYTVGTILSIISIFHSHFSLMLIGRFIAALGAGVGLSITFTIINDFYYPQQARSITAYAAMSFAVMPGLSMALGGVLVRYLGWQSCLYFYILYGILIWAFASLLPETLTNFSSERISFSRIWISYKNVLKHKVILLYAIVWGSTTAVIYLFSSFAPFVSISRFHTEPNIFALFILIPTLGNILGFFLAASLVKAGSARTICVLGAWGTALYAVGFWIVFDLILPSNLSFFIPAAFLYLFIPLTLSNSTVLAMADSDDKATTSSIMSFLNMTMAVIALLIGSLFHSFFLLFLPVVFIILSVLSLLLLYLVKRK